MSDTTAVTEYSAAMHALATAETVDEVKTLRDMASALERYAKVAKDVDRFNEATELRLRSSRKAGEMLIRMKETGERDPGKGGDYRSVQRQANRTLKDMKIAKSASSLWQRLARMSDEDFEALVRSTKRATIHSIQRSQKNWEKRDAREARERALAEKTSTAYPTRKYNVILEDFEWNFEVWSRDTGMDRHAANHYPVSSAGKPEHFKSQAQKIVDFTAPRFECAAEDCVLFMWVPVPFLAVGIDVLRLRGFNYATNFVWGKNRVGTGYWNRNKHEHLLVGVRGNVPAPVAGTQWESLLLAPVGAHSEKPEEFCDLIEWYFPQLSKIELNCRGAPRPGWDAWGNEAEIEEQENVEIIAPEDEEPVFGGRRT